MGRKAGKQKVFKGLGSGCFNVMILRYKSLLAWGAVGIALGILPLAKAAHAGGLFRTLPDLIEREWRSHEISAASLLTASHFSLSASERHLIVRRYLHERGLHPLLNVVARPTDFDLKPAGKFSADLGLVIREYSVRAGTFEVCKSMIRTVDSPRGSSHVLGVMPKVDAVYPTAEESWPPHEDAALRVRQALLEANPTVKTSLTAMSRCLFPVSGELVPAWKITARAGHVPYVVHVTGDEIIEGYPIAFDATAKVKAYQSNPKHPDPAKRALVEFTVEVNGDGYLTNDYFSTGFGDTTARNVAPFDADQTNARHFDEQSSFAHVNRQFQFVSQHGYVWKGPKPLKVLTSYSAAGAGNAQYIPFDGESGPYIIIGPDKAGGLTGLAMDSDVVSHELGHHVVFGSVSDISKPESVVVHEGLSDALTFYQSGDNCLAESICPVTAQQQPCFVPKTCLRTADTTMKYQDSVYNAYAGAPHIRGQVISGLFADLRRGGNIPSDSLNKLLVATVSYLPRQATIQSVIIALLDADYALFGQQYSAIIKEAAAARGMGVADLGINLSEIDGQAPAASSSKKKTSGGGLLGVCSIGAEQQSVSSAAMVVILLLTPIIVSLRRGAHPQVVRVKRSQK